MIVPPRWQRCIAHYDDEVASFVQSYYQDESRRCLLVAGAGFDPRSSTIAELLGQALGDRLHATFLREQRPSPSADLISHGDAHAVRLQTLVPQSRIIDVDVLSPEDRAVVAGQRAVRAIEGERLDGVTDVVVDMSALSVGISFPIAKLLLSKCEELGRACNFHVMVASHPKLDASILSIPNDVVDPVRGFSGDIDLEEREEDPKIWLPHLSSGRGTALGLIRDKLRGPVDIVPVLPLSQRDPRTADRLIAEYANELYGEWEVDPRNLVYAMEDDPLDLYRTISAIYRRYSKVFADMTRSHVVLSPSGSKVLAIGALMAALEHQLPVRYVEAVGYQVSWKDVEEAGPGTSRLVHIWLHGIPYGSAHVTGEAIA